MKLFLLLGSFIAISMSLWAQYEPYNPYVFFNEKYGRSTTLYKGEKYQPTVSHQFGSPLFLNKTFQNSVVVLVNHEKFENIKLKYDIYIDELVFETTDAYGAELNIVLNKADVNYFQLDGRRFEKHNINGHTRYYEVIKDESIYCLVSYSKNYRLFDTPSKKGYGFTDTDRNIMIVLNGDTTMINNNFSLLRLFSKEDKNQVSKWMRENDFRIRTVEFTELEKIIHKINTLITTHEV